MWIYFWNFRILFFVSKVMCWGDDWCAGATLWCVDVLMCCVVLTCTALAKLMNFMFSPTKKRTATRWVDARLLLRCKSLTMKSFSSTVATTWQLWPPDGCVLIFPESRFSDKINSRDLDRYFTVLHDSIRWGRSSGFPLAAVGRKPNETQVNMHWRIEQNEISRRFIFL